MNRLEFTRAKCNLIAAMFLDKEQPIEDYLKRSNEEQYRLYCIGRTFDSEGNLISKDEDKVVTNCDGKNEISGHQKGKAIDIYFLSDDLTTLVDPKKGYKYWHEYWEKKGGKPMIEWDAGHFEG